MLSSLKQHQEQIERNRRIWLTKPLLREIYRAFYEKILALVDDRLPGRIVEIGSGAGNLKTHCPQALGTDLFENPWLDLVCDGYELPFRMGSLSHLVLFDVFHHLQAPNAFLREARRVLQPQGRLILFEPFVSWGSHLVYGVCHPEPVAWRQSIDLSAQPPVLRSYHAAQGNATRLFFRREVPDWPAEWKVFHAECIVSFSYLLSGGFSRPALYPAALLPLVRRMDRCFSSFPGIFGTRCLVAMSPV